MSKSHKFHVTLKDPGSEQRRYTTISFVPCHKCAGVSPGRDRCKACHGEGQEPATAESAAAHLEALEREYVAYRLDEQDTIDRYPTLPENALEIVEQTCLLVPEDTVLIDGRFVRAGKVLPSGNRDPEAPSFDKTHKGWLALHSQEQAYKVERVGRASEQMAVTGGQYGPPLKNMFGGTRVWDWDTDTIKTALTTSTYTVDIDTHDTFTNVTNEITGTNYTAGGWTLTATAPTYDTATDQIRLDANDVSQATATFTARKAVTYKSTGTASTSPLITFLDFGADVSPSAGTFSIVWDVTGIWVHDIT